MNWTVELIQLHFYNGCDNRWQMYQENHGKVWEGPQTSQRFFRVQIAELLTTVRTAFQKAIEATGTDKVAAPNLINPDLSELTNRPEQRGIIVRFADVDEPMFNEFRKFLLEALRRESIDDTELREQLFAWPSGAKTFAWKLSHKSWRHLLCLLPIARDWDVYGRLHPMATSSVRFPEEVGWRRHFAYQVRIVRQRGSPTTDQPLEDRDVFLSFHDSGGWPIPPDVPYFDFAKSGKKSVGPPRMSEKEWSLYRLYASVVDSVQREDLPESVGYFVVVPVIACGYYHFLEVKVAPQSPVVIPGSAHLRVVKPPVEESVAPDDNSMIADAHAEVAKLFGKEEVDYDTMTNSLRELLVQIRLSAFQHRVSEWIRDYASDILSAKTREKVTELATTCFCELAPLINEMRAISCGRKAWSHTEESDRDQVPARFDGQEPEEGWVWRILKRWTMVDEIYLKLEDDRTVGEIRLPNATPFKRTDYRIALLQKGGVAVWLFHEKGRTSFAKKFFEGTNRSRLEEQFEAVQERIHRVWTAWR